MSDELRKKRFGSKPAISVTKLVLVEEMTRATGLSKNKCRKILDSLFEIITESVQQGGRVQIQGFGSFFSYWRPERSAYDMIARKKIRVPPTPAIMFEPRIELRNYILGIETHNPRQDRNRKAFPGREKERSPSGRVILVGSGRSDVPTEALPPRSPERTGGHLQRGDGKTESAAAHS